MLSLRAVLRHLLVIATVLAVAVAACSSQPETCDEIADETIVLMQTLIDDVEREFGEVSAEELIDRMFAGEELPSVTAFEEQAATLSERAGELGCTQDQLEEAVAGRTDQLIATTELGEFIIKAIKSGGL